MTDEQIRRISELAQKSRTPQGLTEAERTEQAQLRRMYIDAMKASLKSQLDHTIVIDEKGRPRRLKPKG